MENPVSQGPQSAEAARRWNRALANRVTRWKRLRLAFAIGLSGAGVLASLSDSASLFMAPCFIAAFIALLLYLDSRDQLRNIKARNWIALTPRIRTLGRAKPGGTGKTTPSA